MQYLGALLLWLLAAVFLAGSLGGLLEATKPNVRPSIGDVVLMVVLFGLAVLFAVLAAGVWSRA